jgi:signal transduction histidine kinase
MALPGFRAIGLPAADPESALNGDSAFADSAHAMPESPLWLGWRLRLLVLAALIGCIGTFSLMWHLSSTLVLEGHWVLDGRGRVVLTTTDRPEVRPFVGQALVSLVTADGQTIAIDSAILHRSPRWTVDDEARSRSVQMHRELGRALAQGELRLDFENASWTTVRARVRGVAGMGLIFWPMSALAVLLYLTGVVVALARPHPKNLLYLLITTCQAANLLFVAFESPPGLPLPAGVLAQNLWWRITLDLVCAAAILHIFTLHPTPLPTRRRIALAGWAFAGVALLLIFAPGVTNLWLWSQTAVLALGLGSIAVLTWSHRLRPHPFTIMMRRFGFVVVGSLGLLTVALAATTGVPGIQGRVGEVGSGVWYVFLASMLLLVPYLSRSSQLLREFAMLAGISTVATSLDLLFVTVFSLGHFASVALSVFLSLGVYAGARQWVLNQINGNSLLSLERSFEKVYRVAREVEIRPERHDVLLLSLLRDLFEPLEVHRASRPARQSRAVADGSALLVPAPHAPPVDGEETEAAPTAWVLRYARRGQRLFTLEDARLADRVCEQLRRAVAYDKAVERGRSEERKRIAQDLHDDIGARLLTLMYKAQDPEMEDYIRHTLLDLKTLTRGLAAADHRLSHAVAEWKSDIGQRLTEANLTLQWRFDIDRDLPLTVVQWSALTRVLRELVTNAISHARATQLSVTGELADDRLEISVADDGEGRTPEQWARGLGLGGVRKRVRLLGGHVLWQENLPRGIVCRVVIDDFARIRAKPGP